MQPGEVRSPVGIAGHNLAVEHCCFGRQLVELHLVQPVVVGGHCLGGNGAAGDDEAELGHGLRM